MRGAPGPVAVVVRARDDAAVISRTLDGLERQDAPYKLHAFDNASRDGTREALVQAGAAVVDVPEGFYVPGRVLNAAMSATQGEFVVFLNSDCVPCRPDWLRCLVAGFDAPDVAAVFGRQIPRPDCSFLFAKDAEDTFGDGGRQKYWRHCFSMASSAIRRSTWEKTPFSEGLEYSEDVDWTWRARRAGWKVRYVADSVVEHSHNYTLRQWRKRQYGEGRAEAAIFEWGRWERSWARYSFLPFARQVLSDWKFALRRGRLGPALFSPILRFVQMRGRRAGFLSALPPLEPR